MSLLLAETRARLEEMLKEHVDAGVVPCRRALEIAEELGVGRPELGRLLEELKTKITSCELGCF